MLNLHNAEFIKSVARNDFIGGILPSVVFAGRSNVGKSSVINRLLSRKNFARVGNTPGKTSFVNYFCIDRRLYFVDLPGYGYAKVSVSTRDEWARLIGDYFAHAAVQPIRPYGLLIIDSRHGPSPEDHTMAGYYNYHGIPYTVIANKCDKLNKTQRAARQAEITAAFAAGMPVVMFSSQDGTGRDEVWRGIEGYIEGVLPKDKN